MKKLILIILTAIFLTGCSADKTPAPEVGGEELPEAEEVEFRQYRDSDFTAIRVNICSMDSTPPVDFREYDMENVDLGVKMSPCKTSAVKESLLRDKDDDFGTEWNENINRVCSRAVGGNVTAMTMTDDIVYLAVNYDDMCVSSSHCFSIWRYGIADGKAEEIYSYSSEDEAFSVTGLKFAKGSLWVELMTQEELSDGLVRIHDICRLNESDGKLISTNAPESMWITNIFPDRLTAWTYNGDNGDKTIYEYFPEKGSWEELITYYEKAYGMGEELVRMEKDEKGRVSAVSDRMRLDTENHGYELRAASEKSLSFTMNTAIGGETLITYDLEKMEKYITEYSGRSMTTSFFSVGDDLIWFSQRGGMYLFIPEMGALFDLCYWTPEWYCFGGGAGRFCTLTQYDTEQKSINGVGFNMMPKKLYVVKER